MGLHIKVNLLWHCQTADKESKPSKIYSPVKQYFPVY